MFDLTGRVALVTGAGQGIGAGIARALASQGSHVAVNDVVADRANGLTAELLSAGRANRSMAVAGDVSDPDAVSKMVDEVERQLGPVDILVNNAGIPLDGFQLRPFRALDANHRDRIIGLNLYGVMHCMDAVLDGMCERGWGRIVTVSSEAGRVGTAIGVSVYGAAKAGAVGLSRHLAMEVARHGVTVNCVSLGTIEHPGADARLVKGYPVGRLGRPEDVGAAVVFLASEEASWITGQNLPVNGGMATS